MTVWDLKEHHIIIIILRNHKGKISIEFPESVNFEKSYLAAVFKSVKIGVNNSCARDRFWEANNSRFNTKHI